MEELEREARRLYRLAGFRDDESATPAALVTGLLGPDSIRVVPESALLGGGGAIARVGDRWRIYLRNGAPPPAARFTVLHELSHWALGQGASEEDCDALAAALLAPRGQFEEAIRATGSSYRKLADYFGCTETFAALRYGEVTDKPLVVVAPAHVRIRGRAFTWPTEPELRQLAKSPRVKGLHKARLRDAPLRVALRVG